MKRLALDRWLLALALVAWLLVPAGSGRAEDAAAQKPPAAKSAEAKPADKAGASGAAAEEEENEAEEERKDAEDEKARAKTTQEGKKWRGKSKEEAKEAEANQARTLSRRAGRFINKATLLTHDGKFDASNEILGRLNPKRLNPYERALVYKFEAYNVYGKAQDEKADPDKRKDVNAAIDLLHKALAENIFTKQDSSDILYQIAMMQMGTNDVEGGVETLKSWFASAEKPSAAAYFMLAAGYFQLKDLDAALAPAKKAVELAETPQQSWIRLLLAIYLTKQDYAAAIPVAAELLTRYPEAGKAYWIQLATLYGVQKDIPRALAVMQLAHRQKFLEDDPAVRRLAQLLQSEEIPYRSVKVLEQGFKDKILKEEDTAYEMLGNSWILARETERAEAPLEKAAQLSGKGTLSVRLGQVRLLKEDYPGAMAALKSALDKGGLDDPGVVEQLLGITYYNAGKLNEARNWFAKSLRSQKMRPTSEQWLKHIDEELQKQNGGSSSAAAAVGM